MKLRILLLLGIISIMSCEESTVKSEETDMLEKRAFSDGFVFTDSDFKGGRLNDFKKLGEFSYQAFITPENIPTNNSPWFCFNLWSKEATKIQLEIAYAENYKHRYIPKLSTDGVNWEPCDKIVSSGYHQWYTNIRLEIDTSKIVGVRSGEPQFRLH